ncbi:MULTISPECIES: hemin uptake protein HemP [unclassified Janthinobacterium]|uniref:hemin uptake protein HemP n=1 Tax=unclassified Janthinobacterium TaxID=2610881 RepID=UPI00034AD7AE|nr:MULTISPECIES: hemin uptake protein HemP [unclassified Janthinobacterium]MEC5161420.1 hemin uptake protein HemP [Janthinobacterium sp. CG_S6]
MHSQKSTTATASIHPAAALSSAQPAQPVRRITSAALLEERREVEIEHAGKVYRLRVTQLNKLILTA